MNIRTSAVEAKDWLEYYRVKNYQLVPDDRYGCLVNAYGFVDLQGLSLTDIPVKFGEVKGFFNCAHNQLTNLDFCPDVLHGNLYIVNNKIDSLRSCPRVINGTFYADKNNLKNLQYGPDIVVGQYMCRNNQLESLEYLPQKVGNIYLDNNPALPAPLQSIIDLEELRVASQIHAEKLQLEQVPHGRQKEVLKL